MTGQNKNFLPVFRFYASLRRTSSLQGNATTGARWQICVSFLGLDSGQVIVSKPPKKPYRAKVKIFWVNYAS